ncbi:unnamed protein product [Sympodiomycopsis kandeliae]
MRLLTHNLLACSARTCLTTSKNFPLTFKDVQLEIVEAEFNEGFLKGLIGGGKIEWNGLIETCKSLGDTSLPEQAPEPGAEGLSDELLQRLHHILLEIHVIQGAMICPNCSHVFPIKNGIPNMLLAAHEVSR